MTEQTHTQTHTHDREGERNKEKFGLKKTAGEKRERNFCSKFEFRDPHT